MPAGPSRAAEAGGVGHAGVTPPRACNPGRAESLRPGLRSALQKRAGTDSLPPDSLRLWFHVLWPRAEAPDARRDAAGGLRGALRLFRLEFATGRFRPGRAGAQ